MPELTYAKTKDGNGISIHDVIKTVTQSSYFCPCCNEPVVARQGSHNAWHFAHKSKRECEGAFQTALHLMAKDILSETKYFYLPDIYTKEHWLYDSMYIPPVCIHKGGLIPIDSVALEIRSGDIIPDIIMTSKGRTFFVEIFVTHKIDENKKWKISELGISTIEIDLSRCDREINKQELSAFLVGDCKEKYWVWNKVAEEQLENIISLQHRNFFSSDKWRRPKEFLCTKSGAGFLLNKIYVGTSQKDGYSISNEAGEHIYVGEIDFTKDGFEIYKCTTDWDGNEEEVIFLPYENNIDKRNKTVFIALSFDDRTKETRKAIKAGIVKAGYTPVFIDETTHDKQTVFELFQKIRYESRFLVIDTSVPNTGAYYEAGYAYGLGKKVIFCCNKESFNSQNKNSYLHFDVDYEQMIVWDTEEELTEQLAQCLKLFE